MYLQPYEPRENTDQPAQPCSLISVLAVSQKKTQINRHNRVSLKKTQINWHNRAVWSVSLLSARRKHRSTGTTVQSDQCPCCQPEENTDQLVQPCSLISVLAVSQKKTQINRHNYAVWSVSLLSARRKHRSTGTTMQSDQCPCCQPEENTDQPEQLCSLISILAVSQKKTQINRHNRVSQKTQINRHNYDQCLCYQPEENADQLAQLCSLISVLAISQKKTQINQHNYAVWSVSLLSARRKHRSTGTTMQSDQCPCCQPEENTDQLAQLCSLINVLAVSQKKTQINRSNYAVWSVSLLSAKRKHGALAAQKLPRKDCDQTLGMCRLICFPWAHIPIGTLSHIVSLPHIISSHSLIISVSHYLTGLGGSTGWAVRLETRMSRVQPPPRSATFFHGDWSWNIFYGHSLPSADSRRAVVSFWRMNAHSTG